jgi:hypothetical protein
MQLPCRTMLYLLSRRAVPRHAVPCHAKIYYTFCSSTYSNYLASFTLFVSLALSTMGGRTPPNSTINRPTKPVLHKDTPQLKASSLIIDFPLIWVTCLVSRDDMKWRRMYQLQHSSDISACRDELKSSRRSAVVRFLLQTSLEVRLKNTQSTLC